MAIETKFSCGPTVDIPCSADRLPNRVNAVCSCAVLVYTEVLKKCCWVFFNPLIALGNSKIILSGDGGKCLLECRFVVHWLLYNHSVGSAGLLRDLCYPSIFIISKLTTQSAIYFLIFSMLNGLQDQSQHYLNLVFVLFILISASDLVVSLL